MKKRIISIINVEGPQYIGRTLTLKVLRSQLDGYKEAEYNFITPKNVSDAHVDFETISIELEKDRKKLFINDGNIMHVFMNDPNTDMSELIRYANETNRKFGILTILLLPDDQLLSQKSQKANIDIIQYSKQVKALKQFKNHPDLLTMDIKTITVTPSDRAMDVAYKINEILVNYDFQHGLDNTETYTAGYSRS